MNSATSKPEGKTRTESHKFNRKLEGLYIIAIQDLSLSWRTASTNKIQTVWYTTLPQQRIKITWFFSTDVVKAFDSIQQAFITKKLNRLGIISPYEDQYLES